MKIILLNGPPSSGKDTALRALCAHFDPLEMRGEGPPFETLRMSAPIKEAYAAMLHLDIDEWGNIAGLDQRHKEQIIPTLGCSPRQWQIDFSERFMKPAYGQNVFVRLWLHRAAQLPADAVVIVPDCGFKIELETLYQYTGPHFTREDIFLIRLYRRGCDTLPGNTTQFRGDSREYVFGRGIREADILNDDLPTFEATIVKQVKSFLTGEP